MGGTYLGLLSSSLAALSTAQIDNSFTTWNAAADSFLGLVAVFFFLKYIQKPKPIYIFFLGFSITLATSIHFQSFLLSPLLLLALLFVRPKIKNIIFAFIGALIPLLPFLYFDVRFHWFETRRIIDYVTIGQSRIYVPNRWLTYAFSYWPQTWSWIIGGQPIIASAIIILIVIVSLLNIKNFTKYRPFYLLAISFAISLIIFRYWRGERFFYYSNFAHAFVIILTAWAIFILFKWSKIIGIFAIALTTVFTLPKDIDNFKPRVITYNQVNKLVKEIYQKYPSSPLAIYECPFNGTMISTAVSYKIYYDHKDAPNGIKIGVCNDNAKISWRILNANDIGKQFSYQNKTNPIVYEGSVEWWVKNPPKEALY